MFGEYSKKLDKVEKAYNDLYDSNHRTENELRFFKYRVSELEKINENLSSELITLKRKFEKLENEDIRIYRGNIDGSNYCDKLKRLMLKHIPDENDKEEKEVTCKLDQEKVIKKVESEKIESQKVQEEKIEIKESSQFEFKISNPTLDKYCEEMNFDPNFFKDENLFELLDGIGIFTN